MTHTRSLRTTYLFAFILGGLFGLLLAKPARAAEPVVLDRVAVVRFTEEGEGKLRRQQGILFDDGRFLAQASSLIDRPANTQAIALGRNLILNSTWTAYYALGFQSLARFELHDGGAFVFFGETAYLLIAPNFEPVHATGTVVNLSTRTRLGTGAEVVTAGFVITERARAVLIRAVGPSLRKFGVVAAASDPVLTVKRGDTSVASNDNWTETPADAAALRVAAIKAGAFPLDDDGKDAACIVELSPGAYTVQIQHAAANASAGEILIEIYTLSAEIPNR